MFDVPADVPPVLVALSLVSTTLLGVALAVRPSPPPAAQPLAGTVDAVAGSDHAAVESRDVDAAAIRLAPRDLAVRGAAGTAHATFAFGPVVPVRRDTALWRVLRGAPPDDAFDGPRALTAAVSDARERAPVWRRDRQQLTVRRVTWRGVDVTLVGA